MDEHLKQAYHEVVYELLISPEAKSAQVLKKNAHLVDEDFMNLLAETAVMLEERNCPEDAAILGKLHQQLQETESLEQWLTEYAPQPVPQKPNLPPEQQKEEAEKLFQKGTQHFKANEYVEAVQAWQQALIFYQGSGDLRGGINCLGKLGVLYQSLGQYQQAIGVHQRSLVFSKKIKYRRGEATALDSLGQVCILLGQYDRAISCYRESLEIAEKINLRNLKVNSLNNLGQAHYVLGEYQQALDCHQQALTLAQKHNFSFAVSQSLSNVAHTHAVLNQLEPAIKFYQQALTRFQESNNPFPQANCYQNLGKLYYRQGQLEPAFDATQSFIKIAQELGYQLAEANGLLDLAELKISQENYEEAIAHGHQALEIYQSIEDLSGQARSLNCLGKIARLQDHPEEAMTQFQESLKIAVPQLHPQEYLTAATHLGDLAFSLENWELATTTYQQVMPILEQRNLSAIPEPKTAEVQNLARQVYSRLIQINLLQQNLESAVEIIERFRCYQFVQKMASHSFKVKEEIAADLELYQRLQRQRDALNLRRQSDELKPLSSAGLRLNSRPGLQAEEKALTILETETDKTWQRLQEADPILASHLRVNPLNFDEIQALIPNPETAILSLFSDQNQTYIFVIKAGEVRVHCCESEGIETLQNWLAEHWVQPYFNHSSTWRNQISPVLLELAQRLQISQVVAEGLDEIEMLMIIPDLNLHFIPFAALPVPMENKPEYLGDQFQLRMIQNCKILRFATHSTDASSLTLGLVEEPTGQLILSKYQCENLAITYTVAPENHLKSTSVTDEQYQGLLQQVKQLYVSHIVNFNYQSPWESQWQLANDPVSLETVLSWDWSEIEEVVFAQSQLQLTTNELDQLFYYHPAAELLCQGVHYMISSLWLMDPIASTMFTLLYYQHRQTLPAPAALQATQTQLRNLTDSEFKTDYQPQLESWIAHQQTPDNQQAVNDVRTSLALLSQQYHPFADPYYWAGYQLQG